MDTFFRCFNMVSFAELVDFLKLMCVWLNLMPKTNCILDFVHLAINRNSLLGTNWRSLLQWNIVLSHFTLVFFNLVKIVLLLVNTNLS